MGWGEGGEGLKGFCAFLMDAVRCLQRQRITNEAVRLTVFLKNIPSFLFGPFGHH